MKHVKHDVKFCSVDGCNSKVEARRMCVKHYTRKRRNGDATTPSLMGIFNSKYMPEPNSGCWIWLGTIKNSGYGIIQYKKNRKRAHRLSFELHNGTIPNGLHVLHRCDNPTCVNPDHLFLGNHTDNMKDMVRKNRFFSKLNRKKVASIKKDKRAAPVIAEAHGVSIGSIRNIKQNKTWRHI